MLKIIIITIDYTLNNLTYSCENIIVDHAKFNNFKFKKTNYFLNYYYYFFVNVETDPRLWYWGFLGEIWRFSCEHINIHAPQ
jgi:hypothetical protein